MNLRQVKGALAAACANVVVDNRKLHTYPYRPNSIIVPAWYIVDFGAIDPQMTMGGRYRAKFKGTVLVSAANDRQSQGQLDDLRSQTGEASIYAALMAARGVPNQLALDGAADDLNVFEIDEPGMYTFGEVSYYGAEFSIEVIGS